MPTWTRKARYRRRFFAGGLVRGRRRGLTSLAKFECSIWKGTYHQRRDEYIMILLYFIGFTFSHNLCPEHGEEHVKNFGGYPLEQRDTFVSYEVVNVPLILSNGDHVYQFFSLMSWRILYQRNYVYAIHNVILKNNKCYCYMKVVCGFRLACLGGLWHNKWISQIQINCSRILCFLSILPFKINPSSSHLDLFLISFPF